MTVRSAMSTKSRVFFALTLCFSGTAARTQAQSAPATEQPLQSSPEPEVSPAKDEGASDGARDDRARRDNLQIGPMVGVGFPRPFAFAGIVKVQRLVALGVEYSFFPETTISDVHTSFWAVAADMRVFPFRDAFFVGLRAGRQHLSADTLLVYGEQRFPIAAAMQTTFLNPRVGLLWTWSSGITLGLDAGLQFPVSSRSSGVLAAPETFVLPQGMEIIDQVRSVADYLGKSTIPTLDLLRLGILL